jgi:hypothetical protein
MSWTIIEPGMYLIAACLLALRPLLNKLSPTNIKSLFQSNSSVRTSKYSRPESYIRRSMKPPASGFIELQSEHGQGDASETNLPIRSIDPDRSLRDYDVEQGSAPSVHHVLGADEK